MILGFVMLLVGVSVAPYQIAQNGSTTATVTGYNMDGTVSVEVWNNDLSARITSGVVVTPGEGSAASRKYAIKISADFELGDYKVVPTINGVRQTGVAGASLKVTDTPVGEYTVSGTITGSDAPGGLAADVQLKQNGVNVGAPVKAGADGKYVISNVAPGIGYTVHAAISGYTANESEAFEVAAANVEEVNLKLQKTDVDKFAITYDPNGGEGGPIDSTLYAIGDTVHVNFTDRPARTHYTLHGWAFDPNTTTGPDFVIGISEEFVLDVPGDVTLYAIWKSSPAIPEHLQPYITEYRITTPLDHITVVEVFLKPEFVGDLAVKYKDDYFKTGIEGDLHLVYSLKGIVQIDDLLVQAEFISSADLISNTTSAVYIPGMGTCVYPKLDSASIISNNLDNSLISVKVNGVKAVREFGEDYNYACTVSSSPLATVEVQVYYKDAPFGAPKTFGVIGS